MYNGEYTITFSVNSRFQFVKVEMYDVAEFINLLSLINENNIYYEEIKKIFLKLFNEFYSLKGFFITRIYKIGLRNNTPYLRWPQAQLFNYLSNIELQYEKLLY